ncbi:hypothetical protein THAOC_22298, partial [Thalassiosira oceanica]
MLMTPFRACVDPYLGCGLPVVDVGGVNRPQLFGSNFCPPPPNLATLRARPPPRLPKPAPARHHTSQNRSPPEDRSDNRVVYGRAESTPFHFRAIGMDGHPPLQSSDDTPPPDDRLDEDARAIRDSAHDHPRGDEIRTGESYFQRRGSRAPRDNEEEEPPRQRRRVEWVVYTGQVLGGKLNGTGKKTLACGIVAEGVFVDGRLNGRGKRTIAQGAVFEGVFVDGSFREGMKTYADGEVQEGVWVINEDGYHRLHGRGKVTLKNRIMQEGVFVDHRLHEGKVTFPNSHVDEGVFVNKRLHGQGKKTYVDGGVLEGGNFVNGFLDAGTSRNFKRMDGGTYTGLLVDGHFHKGKVTFADGEVLEGVFDNNCLKGKLTFPHREVHEGVFDKEVHEGVFRVNNDGTLCLHGPVKITCDGCYEGEFANGILFQGTSTNSRLANGGTHTGKVTLPDPEGLGLEVHEGVFGDGCLNGHGKVTAATFSEEGNFVGGELNGPDILTYADGGVLKGTFVDGHIHAGTAENVKCLTSDDIYTGFAYRVPRPHCRRPDYFNLDHAFPHFVPPLVEVEHVPVEEPPVRHSPVPVHRPGDRRRLLRAERRQALDVRRPTLAARGVVPDGPRQARVQLGVQ